MIVEKSECSDLLTPLIDTVFPKWMENIVHPPEGKNEKSITNLEKKIIKWKIGLISLSVKDFEENVTLFKDPKYRCPSNFLANTRW